MVSKEVVQWIFRGRPRRLGGGGAAVGSARFRLIHAFLSITKSSETVPSVVPKQRLNATKATPKVA